MLRPTGTFPSYTLFSHIKPATMAHLPPELLQSVLFAALEDEPALQRQRTRQSFLSVCRGWAASVARFEQVEVIGSHQLMRLTSPHSSATLGARRHDVLDEGDAQTAFDRVQSLYVELSGSDECGPAPAEFADQALAKLLRWCPNVARLEMRVDRLNSQHSEGNGTDLAYPDTCSLGDSVLVALAGLSRLTSFTLGGLTAAQPVPHFSPSLLQS